MDALLFAIFAVLIAIVAHLAGKSLAFVIVVVGALVLAFLLFAFHRRRVVAKRLLAEFGSLRAYYASAFANTRSGQKFLTRISKPLPDEPSAMDECIETFGTLKDVADIGYTAVTDPGTALLGLAMAPLAIGIDSAVRKFGSAIRKMINGEKTDAQLQLEAYIIHSLQAMKRLRDETIGRELFAVAVPLTIFLFYALTPLPIRTTAEDLVASTEIGTATPVAHKGLESTPAPTPKLPDVVQPLPTQRFATVTEAQRAAVQRYPALGVAGSQFNTEFVARYKLYQQTHPDYFQDTSWPLRLADELTKSSSRQE